MGWPARTAATMARRRSAWCFADSWDDLLTEPFSASVSLHCSGGTGTKLFGTYWHLPRQRWDSSSSHYYRGASGDYQTFVLPDQVHCRVNTGPGQPRGLEAEDRAGPAQSDLGDEVLEAVTAGRGRPR